MDAADLCNFIEQWWGDDFDSSLVSAIAGAPSEKLDAFVDVLREDSLGNLVGELGPGTLRPILSVEQSDLALRLLLYSQEVLVDSGAFGWPVSAYQDPGPAGRIRVELNRLRAIRPLLEARSLRITPVNSRGRHPSTSMMWDGADPEAAATLLDLVQHEVRKSDASLVIERHDLQSIFPGLTGACTLAASGGGHTLATNHLERLVRDALLQSAVVEDRRHGHLTTLAVLSVPNLRGDERLLARLREDSEQFAEWRSALSQALTYVGDVAESEEGVNQASAIVFAELRSALARLESSTDRSTTLSTAKFGVARFGLAGFGVGAGYLIAGGNPIGSAIGGASIAAAETASHYVSTMIERRRGKAILDVAALFEP